MSTTETTPVQADGGKRRPSEFLLAGRKLLDEQDPVRAHTEFDRWVGDVARWLEVELDEPRLSARWCGLENSMLIVGGHYYNDPQAWRHFHSTVQRRLQWLDGAISSSRNTEVATDKEVRSTAPGRAKVFVVHGHNEALREVCARFLEQLGLNPVILHEQPSKGRTIIEKFEGNADVAFAVVLMTADDEGRKIGTSDGALTPRARQNVVLELGFFLGRLGRERVCAIYESNVEVPNDYAGVVFIEYDRRGAWK